MQVAEYPQGAFETIQGSYEWLCKMRFQNDPAEAKCSWLYLHYIDITWVRNMREILFLYAIHNIVLMLRYIMVKYVFFNSTETF